MTAVTAMTRSERNDLLSLARQRERLAKASASVRSAELLADFEQQLGAMYSWDDDAVWAEAKLAVDDAVASARAAIADRCEALGIPPTFRPGLSLGWYSRGENAIAARRAELRKVATTRLAALEKAARHQIEAASLRVQTELVASGLTSEAAVAFLDAMPSPAQLMPPLAVRELEAALLSAGRAARLP